MCEEVGRKEMTATRDFWIWVYLLEIFSNAKMKPSRTPNPVSSWWVGSDCHWTRMDRSPLIQP